MKKYILIFVLAITLFASPVFSFFTGTYMCAIDEKSLLPGTIFQTETEAANGNYSCQWYLIKVKPGYEGEFRGCSGKTKAECMRIIAPQFEFWIRFSNYKTELGALQADIAKQYALNPLGGTPPPPPDPPPPPPDTGDCEDCRTQLLLLKTRLQSIIDTIH